MRGLSLLWLSAALLISCQVKLVQSYGSLMVQFIQFQSNGRLATGVRCDPNTSSGNYNPCDPQFVIKADRYSSTGSGLYRYSQYRYYQDQDNVTFGSYFYDYEYIKNPVTILVADSSTNRISAGQNTVWLVVEVSHVDWSQGRISLMSSFTTQLPVLSGAATTLVLTSSNGHRLTIKYWFACDTNYYDQYCNTYCYTTNGWCNSLGQITCYYGWIDNSTSCTTKHPCRSCACRNGGTCVGLGAESYICLCQPGYSGSNCQYCFSGSCADYSPSSGTCDLCNNCQLATSFSFSNSTSCGSRSIINSAYGVGATIGVLIVLALIASVAVCYTGYCCRCCCCQFGSGKCKCYCCCCECFCSKGWSSGYCFQCSRDNCCC